jgi:hypothetical protein
MDESLDLDINDLAFHEGSHREDTENPSTIREELPTQEKREVISIFGRENINTIESTNDANADD